MHWLTCSQIHILTFFSLNPISSLLYFPLCSLSTLSTLTLSAICDSLKALTFEAVYKRQWAEEQCSLRPAYLSPLGYENHYFAQRKCSWCISINGNLKKTSMSKGSNIPGSDLENVSTSRRLLQGKKQVYKEKRKKNPQSFYCTETMCSFIHVIEFPFSFFCPSLFWVFPKRLG